MEKITEEIRDKMVKLGMLKIEEGVKLELDKDWKWKKVNVEKDVFHNLYTFYDYNKTRKVNWKESGNYAVDDWDFESYIHRIGDNLERRFLRFDQALEFLKHNPSYLKMFYYETGRFIYKYRQAKNLEEKKERILGIIKGDDGDGTET